MTAAERAILQEMVDDLYDQFVAVVAEGRKMEPDRVRRLADGRIYTGRQAKKLGLVDEMGTQEDAVNAAAQLAGIAGKPAVHEVGRGGLWEMLLGADGQSLFDGLANRLLFSNGTGSRLANPGLVPQFR